MLAAMEQGYLQRYAGAVLVLLAAGRVWAITWAYLRPTKSLSAVPTATSGAAWELPTRRSILPAPPWSLPVPSQAKSRTRVTCKVCKAALPGARYTQHVGILKPAHIFRVEGASLPGRGERHSRNQQVCQERKRLLADLKRRGLFVFKDLTERREPS